jgi:pyruvate formate lyase activating enzyme
MCLIPPEHAGDCKVRINHNGKLIAATYGLPCAIHQDPVEKKPLFHFLPGSKTLSIATVGCNLHCKNCQNWQISQSSPFETDAHDLPPKEVISLAKKILCPSVSLTYTEPLVFFEYSLHTAREAKENGLKTVLVSAGYANPAPLKELYSQIHAANIDLKSISDDFYRNFCDATLKPIQVAMVLAKEMGVHLEITHLLIPGLNDQENQIKALCRWVYQNLGEHTPLHISRFYPNYKMRDIPPTPEDTLYKAWNIANEEGLSFVYLGNLKNSKTDTVCHRCNRTLIKRTGYQLTEFQLQDGTCPYCHTKIPGIWSHI